MAAKENGLRSTRSSLRLGYRLLMYIHLYVVAPLLYRMAFIAVTRICEGRHEMGVGTSGKSLSLLSDWRW